VDCALVRRAGSRSAAAAKMASMNHHKNNSPKFLACLSFGEVIAIEHLLQNGPRTPI
jgi:hypothetical protein